MAEETVSWGMEFAIPGKKLDLLKKNTHQVKHMFGVDVDLGNAFKRNGSEMQWIHVKGGTSSAEDMKNAKTYIVSMTNPEACISVENFPPSVFDKCVHEVTTSTGAFLEFKKKSVVIQGSELSVVLAQSMLESIQQDDGENVADDPLPLEDAASAAQYSNKPWLNSKSSDSHKDSQNASSHPPPLPSTLHQPPSKNRIPQAFQSSSKKNIPVQMSTHSSSTSTTKSSYAERELTQVKTVDSFDSNAYSNIITACPSVPSSSTKASSSFSSLAASFSSLDNNKHMFLDERSKDNTVDYSGGECGHSNNNIAKGLKTFMCVGDGVKVFQKNVTPDAGIDMQYDYLKSLGMAENYDVDVIEEGLRNCDMTDVIKPADFLKNLKAISQAQRLDYSVIVIDGDDDDDDEEEEEMEEEIDAIVISSDDDQSKTPLVSQKKKKRKKRAKKPQEEVENMMEVENLPQQTSDLHHLTTASTATASTTQTRPSRIPSPGRALPGPSSAKPHHPHSSGNVPSSSSLSTSTHGATFSSTQEKRGLRYIVIDGNNVAMAHGGGKFYSVKGIQICINYFLTRGHKVTAFVPESRRYAKNSIPIQDRNRLEALNSEGHVKFTPSRRLQGTGKVITCYDDRFVLNLADIEKGIVVSNDQYRDLLGAKPTYREIIETRLLQFTFVGDHFMPPDDPLGRDGPSLDDFLRLPGGSWRGAYGGGGGAYGYGGGGGACGGGGGRMDVTGLAKHPCPPDRSSTVAFPSLLGQEEKNLPGQSSLHSQRQQANQPSQPAANFSYPNSRTERQNTNTKYVWHESQQHQQQKATEKQRQSQKDKVDVIVRERDGPFNNRNTNDVRVDALQLQGVVGLDFRSNRQIPPPASTQNPKPSRGLRTEHQTKEMVAQLSLLFPESEQQQRIVGILQNHPDETDMTRLTNYVINALAL